MRKSLKVEEEMSGPRVLRSSSSESGGSDESVPGGGGSGSGGGSGGSSPQPGGEDGGGNEEMRSSEGEGGGVGGGVDGPGVGGSGSGSEVGRKGTLRLVADGMLNGLVMMGITQWFSALYFEQPRAMLVGVLLSLISCIVMLLGVKSIARFIVFQRLIMRTTRHSPARSQFLARWLEEIVMHGVTLFITLLLLSLSRMFV